MTATTKSSKMVKTIAFFLLLISSSAFSADSDATTEVPANDVSPPAEKETSPATQNSEEQTKPPTNSNNEETPSVADKKESDNPEEKKTALGGTLEQLKEANPTGGSGEVTKANAPIETVAPNEEAANLGKLGDLLNIETTTGAAKDLKEEAKPPSESVDEKKEKLDVNPTQLSDVKQPSSGELGNTPTSESIKQDAAKPNDTPSPLTDKNENTADTTPKDVALGQNVESGPKTDKESTKDNNGNQPQHNVENPPTSSYTAGLQVTPADHKMNPTEQNAYICSLTLPDGELCPMSINLEENVGITDPGANAFCNDVVAAPMGFKGFCVALSKIDPETKLPIFTKTCAYYEKEKGKCSTNFLTIQAQPNSSSQVRYTCPNNGITNYIPTSCVKKNHH